MLPFWAKLDFTDSLLFTLRKKTLQKQIDFNHFHNINALKFSGMRNLFDRFAFQKLIFSTDSYCTWGKKIYPSSKKRHCWK